MTGETDDVSQAIDVALFIRDQIGIPLEEPLVEVVVASEKEGCLERLKASEGRILHEVNARKLTLTTDGFDYGLRYRPLPDLRSLRAKFGSQTQDIAQECRKLDHQEMVRFLECGEVVVSGVTLTHEDIQIAMEFDDPRGLYRAFFRRDMCVFLLIQNGSDVGDYFYVSTSQNDGTR